MYLPNLVEQCTKFGKYNVSKVKIKCFQNMYASYVKSDKINISQTVKPRISDFLPKCVNYVLVSATCLMHFIFTVHCTLEFCAFKLSNKN